jgi:hypothetical protein
LPEKIDARFPASRVILSRGIEIAKRKKRKIERGESARSDAARELFYGRTCVI